MLRRRAYVAACAVVLLVVAQLVALAHHAETRHITCSEHGEELEAATLLEQLHACDQDHLIGVKGAATDHEDCLTARALHHSTQISSFALAPTLISYATSDDAVVVVDLAPTTALYLIAPKTSPPARLRLPSLA